MKKLLIILFIFTFIISGLSLSGKNTYRTGKPLILKSKLKMELKEIGRSIKRNKKLDPMTHNRWKELIKELHESKTPFKIEDLVQSVLRESYMEMEKDLEYFSSKVKYFNKLKKGIRNHMKELRGHLRQFRGERGVKLNRGVVIRVNIKNFSPSLIFSKRVIKNINLKKPDLTKLRSGRVHFTTLGVDIKTKEELQKYIDELEKDFQTAVADAQLANLDMQSILKKQQQTIQLLGNVSKALSDLAMAVMRKLG